MQTSNTDLWQRITVTTRGLKNDDFTVHEGVLDAASVRITIVDKQLAEQTEFRAAFRTDIEQLQQLNHPSIATTLGWGEHSGTIFYVNQINQCVPVQQLLQQHTLTWEEFIDVAWQISSALQHVHNAGLTHGHLDHHAILIDDALRISVCDFGLYRWIQQTRHPNIVPMFPDAAHDDIVQLGNLLNWLIQQISEEAISQAQSEVTDIQNLIQLSCDSTNDVTARDFQGHLGDLLLQDTADVIDMVDHREGQQTSRRSIVDELFDDEDQFKASQTNAVQLPNQPDYIVAGLILALVGLIAVLMIFTR